MAHKFKNKLYTPFLLCKQVLLTTFFLIFITASFINTTLAEPLEMKYIEYPPYYFTNKGNPSGFLLEYTRQVMSLAGVEVRFKSLPSKRILHTIQKNNNAGSIGWFKNEKRETYAKFSLPIYESKPIGILVRAQEKTNFAPYRTLADLIGKTELKIALIAGHSEGAYVDSLLQKFPTHVHYLTGKQEQLIKMLRTGRSDYCLLAPEEVDILIAKSNLERSDFSFIPLSDIPSGNKRYLIFSRNIADSVLARINNAIKQLGPAELAPRVSGL